jgi:hypothetical protein
MPAAALRPIGEVLASTLRLVVTLGSSGLYTSQRSTTSMVVYVRVVSTNGMVSSGSRRAERKDGGVDVVLRAVAAASPTVAVAAVVDVLWV